MAKVSLNKICPIKSRDIKTITIHDQEVQIIQYLPIEKKVELVEQVLNSSIDDLYDFNTVRLQVYYTINLLKYYTNISFTETQLNDVVKLYNLLILNEILINVESAIPEAELNTIQNMIKKETDRIRTYYHSAAGVLHTIQEDYNATSMNVDGLIQKLQTGENFELVKDIVTKTGGVE